MPAQVEIEFFDTTLRDGAQSLPEDNQFADGSKVEIARAIASLGIDVIEAGFPRTEGDDIEVKSVAETIGQESRDVAVWRNGQLVKIVDEAPVIAGLCRTTLEDILITWESVEPAEKPRIHTFISTDDEHMIAKFPGKNKEEVLEMGRMAVALAREISSANPNASVEFSAEAASTTDPDYLERVVATAINEGADVINLPDTVGQRQPFWMKNFYDRVIGWIMRENPAVIVSAHNHNDRAMAAANTVGLVFSAIEFAKNNNHPIKIQLETTICGLGERAGNADIFPTVASLFKDTQDQDIAVTWKFNPKASVNVARQVMASAGLEVHRQGPVVGSDTNVHRSGIHSDGVIKGGYQIYTPHNPTFWGHPDKARHEEGRYQGTSGRLAMATT